MAGRSALQALGFILLKIGQFSFCKIHFIITADHGHDMMREGTTRGQQIEMNDDKGQDGKCCTHVDNRHPSEYRAGNAILPIVVGQIGKTGNPDGGKRTSFSPR